jgi:hypothetical protein
MKGKPDSSDDPPCPIFTSLKPVYGKKTKYPSLRLGMNGNGGLGAEGPMAFSLGRSSNLWSELLHLCKFAAATKDNPFSVSAQAVLLRESNLSKKLS